MKIAVIGTGYVGLVTGTCFAETGNNVTCVDIDKSKVEKLSSGQVTIYEPGLEKIFVRNEKEGRLHFTTSLEEGIKDAKIIFLALPTPPDGDGNADLKYVLGVAKDMGRLLKKDDYKIIIDKSTVPVGTAEKVRNTILKNSGEDIEAAFDIVSNPEFLREGVAVDAFMNEIAQLCERVGADVDMVRRGMGSDERIGRRFLFPGIGYGGSCFPKDVKALEQSSREIDYDFKILKAVMQVNEKQKLHLVQKIKTYFNNDLNGKKIALWGLAFKPNTDDIREASALTIIDELTKAGAKISAFDSEAMANVKRELGNKIEYAENQYDALNGADALVIATEWSEFRTPDFNRIGSLLKNKVIFDGRNLFDLVQMEECGFYYQSIGRRTITPKEDLIN